MLKNKVFETLQKVGGAFMLPIALLPIAGLMLGIGASFTNEITIATYQLEAILGEGTPLHGLLTIMKNVGDIIFGNLPILFAICVAAALANREKYVAGIAGAVGFFVMNITIYTMLSLQGMLEPGVMPDGALGMNVGILTLQMGVFGGIIVGLGVAALHNKFYNIKFPTTFAFFSGVRFIPIITTFTYILVGMILFYTWGYVQAGIASVGSFVNSTGYFGTFVYGFIERSLIPFGLHHVFYLPFWQTAVGGSQMIDGTLVSGGQNIFFAELASPNTTHFNVEAAKYMMGKFPVMLFGLPAAALAMYHTAKPENKKAVGGLLFSAALTSIITGITEPLEFSFLFVAPVLYAVHAVYAGLSFMLMHIMQVAIGQTFSGSLIDFILFGVMQGNDKTNWVNTIWIGLAYLPLYYFTFRFLITKLNLKTPGREDKVEDVKLYNKKDYLQDKAGKAISQTDEKLAQIVAGLGGAENITRIENCATRLRISVSDANRVDKAKLEAPMIGAKGVLTSGTGVQIIIGTQVPLLKTELEDYLEGL